MSLGNNSAGTTARASAELQKALADVSLPAMKEALSQFTADLGNPGEEPSTIRKAHGDARSALKQDFVTSEARGTSFINQQALQSGMLPNQGAVSESIGTMSRNLRSSEGQQLRALNFAEAQAGLGQTNSLLSNITGVSGNLLSGSLRFGGQALQSDQLLAQYQQQGQQQGTAIGSALGALIGTIVYPGIGTAIGTGIGGLAGGYFGGQ